MPLSQAAKALAKSAPHRRCLAENAAFGKIQLQLRVPSMLKFGLIQSIRNWSQSQTFNIHFLLLLLIYFTATVKLFEDKVLTSLLIGDTGGAGQGGLVLGFQRSWASPAPYHTCSVPLGTRPMYFKLVTESTSFLQRLALKFDIHRHIQNLISQNLHLLPHRRTKRKGMKRLQSRAHPAGNARTKAA